jgi:hypothetical protein
MQPDAGKRSNDEIRSEGTGGIVSMRARNGKAAWHRKMAKGLPTLSGFGLGGLPWPRFGLVVCGPSRSAVR